MVVFPRSSPQKQTFTPGSANTVGDLGLLFVYPASYIQWYYAGGQRDSFHWDAAPRSGGMLFKSSFSAVDLHAASFEQDATSVFGLPWLEGGDVAGLGQLLRQAWAHPCFP